METAISTKKWHANMILVLILGSHYGTGKHLQTREKVCNQTPWNHVLPDENCTLHHFCAKPQPSPYNSIMLYGTRRFTAEKLTSIPYSNTEFYTYLSLYICKYSVRDMSDPFLFKEMTNLLNTTVNTGTSFSQPCTPPMVHHFAPDLTCNLQKFCSTPAMTPTMEIFIYNKTIAESEKLLPKAFYMGYTNTKIFHEQASILCQLQNIDLIDNKNLNTLTRTELLLLTNNIDSNISQVSNDTVYDRNVETPFPLFMILAIVLISFCLSFLLQLWFVYRKPIEKKFAVSQISSTSKQFNLGQSTEQDKSLSVDSNSPNNDKCVKNYHEIVEILSNEDTLEDTNLKNVQVREFVDAHKESEEKQIHEAYSPRSCTRMEMSNDEVEPFLPVHPD